MAATSEDFDFIIVGAGSAGCIVANRLSADGRATVLLLEAGPSDWHPFLRIPLGYAHSFNDAKVNWRYASEPEPGLGGRVAYVPRGRVLGGSSTINALVYARGQAQDFDGWAAEGNPGWAWADVLPFYRKLEDHPLGPGPMHGQGGPVAISDVSADAHPLCRSFIDASAEVGFAYNPDLNGESTEGIGHYQVTARKGRRSSTARAYLAPARGRANLTIATAAQATRLLMEGSRIVGVEYRRHGAIRTAKARREVVVSAGAINTPQLLMLSGLGPAAHLRGHGIAVAQDLPAVGQHLQDHIGFDIFYKSRVPSINSSLATFGGKLAAGLDYLLRRRGILAMSMNQAGGFVRTALADGRPDLQLYFCPVAYTKPPAGSPKFVTIDPEPAFSLSGSPCRPKSRGSITLKSAEPLAPPAIRLNLLEDPADMEVALAGFDVLRRIGNASGLATLSSESRPGAALVAREEIAAYLRQEAYSIFHPCGSCRMGPDPRSAVVDSRLRVHGVQGLRLVDASIFPSVPSGNTNAPSMLVGEMGAAAILAG